MLDYGPYSRDNQFRRRRIELLKQLVCSVLSEKEHCSLIDVGGEYRFWAAWGSEFDLGRIEITCVNYHLSAKDDAGKVNYVRKVQGDARALDNIEDNQYDIAFSNSVLEHVGLWSDMTKAAHEIRRVARRHLVQTPYYWFPYEPHVHLPFIHWLPEPLAYRMTMLIPCGRHGRQETVAEAISMVQVARLLDYRSLEALFPDSEIIREKFLGITKSLIALKRK